MNMIPIKALSEEVDNEAIAPEVGDEVPVSAVLRIKAVKDGQAEYELAAVNGHECAAPKATADEKKPRTMAQERADLMKAAMAADKRDGWED